MSATNDKNAMIEPMRSEKGAYNAKYETSRISLVSYHNLKLHELKCIPIVFWSPDAGIHWDTLKKVFRHILP